MNRRSYLVACVSGTAGLAGCSGLLDSGGGGDPSGPKAVTRAFIEALIAGDVETANEYLHPESPVGAVTQSNAESFQSADVSIESVTVDSRAESTTEVSVELRGETPDGQRTVTRAYELRTHEGEWRMYRDLSASGSPPSVPAVQWESSERTDDDGNVSAVEFQHEGGETVPSGTLAARVEGSSAAAPEGTDVSAGTRLIVPLDGSGESIAATTDVTLVWSSPDGAVSRELTMHAIGSSTVGGLGETLEIDA